MLEFPHSTSPLRYGGSVVLKEGFPKAVEIARAMGAKEVTPFSRPEKLRHKALPTDSRAGGAIMGSSPDRSVVNPYLQHWRVPNLFVLGASSFPQNASANPTPTVLAITYRTADTIVERYLKNPVALL
jgi:gluconate 2-dehydrogenase alpha chain